MQFRDETADLVLDTHSLDVTEMRFHLATSPDQEVLAHFKATFTHLKQMQKQRYSAECTLSVKQALYEILLEMRIRGFEADYAGTVYRAPVIVPVPGHLGVAGRRQAEKLKRLNRDSLKYLCETTRKLAAKAASQESKGPSFARA
jgi:hypothetical protein